MNVVNCGARGLGSEEGVGMQSLMSVFRVLDHMLCVFHHCVLVLRMHDGVA